MSEFADSGLLDSAHVRARVQAGLTRRRKKEKRFQRRGLLAVMTALGFLAVLLVSLLHNASGIFWQTHIALDVDLSQEVFGPPESRSSESLNGVNYGGLIKSALRAEFPNVKKRREKRELYGMMSPNAGFILRDRVLANPELIGTTARVWLPADDDIDMLRKGYISLDDDQSSRRISDREALWIEQLDKQGRVDGLFNVAFFTSGDSREPETAGILGALKGSLLTLLVTFLLAFPAGVMAAIYLEEFAKKNLFTDFLEVNINNLAAVPSIVFGLLGLAVFINFFGLPRSASLVGGMVLALMTLPTIIIASRVSLQSVPHSIREAALGVGASPLQTIFHHVLPLALPGMLTGSIIGMARALGESAPLLMIGMVAFVVDIPQGFTDPATVLPVQVYLWADSPERAFVERTSAAILVLLLFLVLMNGLAVWMRQRMEQRNK